MKNIKVGVLRFSHEVLDCLGGSTTYQTRFKAKEVAVIIFSQSTMQSQMAKSKHHPEKKKNLLIKMKQKLLQVASSRYTTVPAPNPGGNYTLAYKFTYLPQKPQKSSLFPHSLMSAGMNSVIFFVAEKSCDPSELKQLSVDRT